MSRPLNFGMTKAEQRTRRLFNLIPYLQNRPGIRKVDAARELGVTVKELVADLNVLWMCGLPGARELIDIHFDGDTVDVVFSAGIDEPLRLTSEEAGALTLALRALADMPGVVDPSAAVSALAKVEAALGIGAGSATATIEGDPEAAAAVREAVRQRRALRMTYYSASRDAISERVVDPIATMVIDNNSYLQAWCRQADGVRLFRFDRIESGVVLDEPAVPHDRPADDGLEVFRGDDALPLARLRIAAASAWLTDQYPMTIESADPDGRVIATMRFGTTEWIARLVLGFGADVEVLEPQELADIVRRQAQSALRAYV